MNADPATREPVKPIKLGFVINDMATEKNNYTTIRLARKAVERGHEVRTAACGAPPRSVVVLDVLVGVPARRHQNSPAPTPAAGV